MLPPSVLPSSTTAITNFCLIPLAASSPSPFSTTPHRHPIDGTCPHPQCHQCGADVGVCVIGVRAVRCCFSGTNHHPAATAASMALASISQRRLFPPSGSTTALTTTTTMMTRLAPSVMMSSSFVFWKSTTTLPAAAADAGGGTTNTRASAAPWTPPHLPCLMRRL